MFKARWVWLLLCSSMSFASTATQDMVVNEPGLAYSNTYILDMDESPNVSMQVNWTSATFTAASFDDGTASSGTFTVVSYTALSTAAATGSLTMVSTTAALGAAGTALVQFGNNVAGAIVRITGPPGDQNYTTGGDVALGAVSSNTASNFATAVAVSSNSSGLTATQTGTSSAVTLTCIRSGAFCNSYAVTSSSAAEVSTAAFSGGVDAVKVTIDGYAYVAGVDFLVGTSTSMMAVILSTTIAASSATTKIDASAKPVGTIGSGVVFATYTVTGAVGNKTLASSNPLAISTGSNVMTGGQDNATFAVNGVTFTANVNFSPVTSTAQTATNIAAAITSSAATTGVIAAAAGSVVFATSTMVGPNTTYALASSSNAALTVGLLVSSTTAGVATGIMTGGTSAEYTINTGTISVPNHGLTRALLVVYATSTAAGISPLVALTTYYIVPIDANTLALSPTSTSAVAGTYITLTSSNSSTTKHTFTLTPAVITGLASFKWEGSNDRTLWSPIVTPYAVVVGSVTMGTYVFGSTSTVWDVGPYDYHWLRLNVLAPTQGGVAIRASVHGKGR